MPATASAISGRPGEVDAARHASGKLWRAVSVATDFAAPVTIPAFPQSKGHKMFHWTTEDIPSQSGRRVVTTGATGGLGYETALALAAAGAEVVLTGRNAVKGKTALESIRAQYPTVSIRYQRLDLASLRSVADGALPMVRCRRCSRPPRPTRRVAPITARKVSSNSKVRWRRLSSHGRPWMKPSRPGCGTFPSN